ncbi:DUF1127 domain-containing protein [Sneathiella chungangensis]|uniref:DUF1127 domain-containing protein n=1 Tax=Sneathiella chungangensis TaxID=1418234 RepID=A0A845MIC6_9PROT|nr:DUF1127 domain-containing protein [Sneathiella chungangensis]
MSEDAQQRALLLKFLRSPKEIQMLNFGETLLTALALIEPRKTDNRIFTEPVQISQTNRSDIISALKVPGKWIGRLFLKYRRRRDLDLARFRLYGMSDLHLQDIGLRRCDIYDAVERKAEAYKKKKSGLLKAVKKKLMDARKTREAYVQLMSMDARQLADIGLTRSDLQAVRNGIVKDFANCNRLHASNTNDRRRAG